MHRKGANKGQAGQSPVCLGADALTASSDEQRVFQPDAQYSRQGPLWNIPHTQSVKHFKYFKSRKNHNQLGGTININ